MAERTSVATDAAGRRVMAKVAGTADEAVRLEREAALLESARHPGVVELEGVEGHGVGAILLTAHVDGPTLGRVGRLPLEESAGLLAAVASTLADLHDLGVVHGAVCPDHVIVGRGGRPVLCGFAYGGHVGQPLGPVAAVPPQFADPAAADSQALAPSLDVFAIGALARFLAPDPPAGHVLGKVAAEAMSEDASARPSARALAEALQREVPAARLPRGLDPGPVAPPRRAVTDPLAGLRREGCGVGARQWARPPAAAVIAAVAAIGVIGAAIVLAGSSTPQAPVITEMGAPPLSTTDPPAPDEDQPEPTTTRPGLASSTGASRPSDCPPATGVLQADVDRDGCADEIRYADGILQAGDARWSLGEEGDQVAIGDWACRGSRTPAIFRPSTGEVFRFDGWAGLGHDITATSVGRVQGGLALRAADVDRDGCHEVVVERASGVAEVVRLRRDQP